MQHLEVSSAVRHIYVTLGGKGLMTLNVNKNVIYAVLYVDREAKQIA
jgi:hypothetical protein